MGNDFEALIASFIENNVGVSNNFLNDNLTRNLKNNLLTNHKNDLLLLAGTGKGESLNFNTEIRSDSIYWLDRKHEDQYENEFFDLIEGFIKHLNISCYAGITDCEFHYSLYEKDGFYKKHLDRFQNNSGRKFSMISYLNEDWQEKDGGELMIHQEDNNQKIAPTNGKTIFFKSDELVHEVLLTNKRRMSVTGWLKGL